MANTKFSTSSINQGLVKSRSMLVGNTFYDPTEFESIATVIVGAGGSPFVEFTSIPQTYAILQIRGLGRTTTSNTDDNVYMQFNGDTGNNYSAHYLYSASTTPVSAAASSQPNVVACRITGDSTSSNIFGVGIVDILDYSNTNKNTTTRVLTAHNQGSSAGFVLLSSGLWQNTSAITSIKLYVSPNNLAQYSKFALYGIKD